MISLVLFDLDGTLSNSAPGILAALRQAFAEHGLAPLDPVTEQALLGPPFYESLPPLIGGEHLVASVIASYREHYGAGTMFETEVYPGVVEVLQRLRAASVRMAVATSKPEHYAVPIVERLGLAEYFETVGGDELDGSLRTKELVIGKVLSRVGPVPPAETLMVGDRAHDVIGAAAHGIACAGALWGYGLPGELADAGADPLCADPGQLLDLPGLAAAVAGGGRGAAAS